MATWMIWNKPKSLNFFPYEFAHSLQLLPGQGGLNEYPCRKSATAKDFAQTKFTSDVK